MNKITKKEFSSGAVLYTEKEGVRYYVLIVEPNGSYGFPKGHIRHGESVKDCALREIKEETGIDATLIPNFKRTIKYVVLGHSLKQVTFFLGYFDENEQELSPIDSHIKQAKLYTREEAIKLLKFQQIKDILTEVDFMLDLKDGKDESRSS